MNKSKLFSIECVLYFSHFCIARRAAWSDGKTTFESIVLVKNQFGMQVDCNELRKREEGEIWRKCAEFGVITRADRRSATT